MGTFKIKMKRTWTTEIEFTAESKQQLMVALNFPENLGDNEFVEMLTEKLAEAEINQQNLGKSNYTVKEIK